MSENSFLDKSVLLGYCFITDTHNNKCGNYLSNGREYYITEEVMKSFDRNKARIVEDHGNAIRKHSKKLTESRYSGELGPAELKEIRQNLITKKNPAWRYLRDYYSSQQITSVYEVTSDLRELARDIEQLAVAKKQEFEDKINWWERGGDHEDVQDALDEIRQDKAEDFWICIDAHDLASKTSQDTELATADVKDFKRNGRQDLILDNTDIDSIAYLAVTSKQV